MSFKKLLMALIVAAMLTGLFTVTALAGPRYRNGNGNGRGRSCRQTEYTCTYSRGGDVYNSCYDEACPYYYDDDQGNGSTVSRGGCCR